MIVRPMRRIRSAWMMISSKAPACPLVSGCRTARCKVSASQWPIITGPWNGGRQGSVSVGRCTGRAAHASPLRGYELDLGGALAAGFTRGSSEAPHERMAAEELVNGLADGAGPLAVDDANGLQAGQVGIVEVAVQLLGGLVAPLAAQIELQRHRAAGSVEDHPGSRLAGGATLTAAQWVRRRQLRPLEPDPHAAYIQLGFIRV